MIQIALVSRTGKALDAYLRFFETHGAEPIYFSSIAELYRKLPDMMISGLVVDLPTLVRAAETEMHLSAAVAVEGKQAVVLRRLVFRARE